MNPIQFKEANGKLLAGDIPNCEDLTVYKDGKYITSCWELTPLDMIKLMKTRKVYLSVMAPDTSPPVMLMADSPFEKEPMTVPMPHDGLYTRLQRSDIAGIGVFAIIPIAKDTDIFPRGDDDPGMILENEHIEAVKLWNAALGKMYTDFCVKEADGTWWCSSNFSAMGMAYYLNHSDSPNCYCTEDLAFVALRDIEPGEELTVDYRTYSNEGENVEESF